MEEGPLERRPLTLAELTAHLASGSKSPADFRIGSEHEKFVFRLGSHEPVEYERDAEGRGGSALLDGLVGGWEGVYEANDAGGETLIALSRGAANVSLEPGGQFELSGAAAPDHPRDLPRDRPAPEGRPGWSPTNWASASSA